MTLYCLVENNSVTRGPMELPFAFGNMTGFNRVADPAVYGWYPYNDPGAPAHDDSTQSLLRSFIVDSEARTVTAAYTIEALPLAQLQDNAQPVIEQSYQSKLQRRAAAAAAKGDTRQALQYLLKARTR